MVVPIAVATSRPDRPFRQVLGRKVMKMHQRPHQNVPSDAKRAPIRALIRLRSTTASLAVRAGSLADAEAREDPVEQVVGVDRAGHLPELVECGSECGGRKLRRVGGQDVAAGGAEVIGARRDVMPAPALARRQCRPGERRDAVGEDERATARSRRVTGRYSTPPPLTVGVRPDRSHFVRTRITSAPVAASRAASASAKSPCSSHQRITSARVAAPGRGAGPAPRSCR